MIRSIARALALVLTLSGAVSAQTYSALPPVFIQFSYDSGAPVALGWVCTYEAGTTTKLGTYSTPSGTDNDNPIHLSVGGRASIYLKPQAYKINLYAPGTGNFCGSDAVGALIRSIDNVSDAAQILAAADSVDFIRICSRFDGGNAGVRIAACIADLPSTGGTADARGMEGAQTILSTITLRAGVRLLLGAATFTFSGTTVGFSMAAGSHIQCISPASTILYFPGTAVDGIYPHNNTSIRDCTIRGPGGATHRDGFIGIDFGGKSNVSIIGNVVEQWGSHCINTGANSFNVDVENNIIRDCHQDGFLSPAGATNLTVRNNWTYDNGSWGLDCTCSNSIIEGNHIYDNGAIWTPDGGGIASLAYIDATTRYDVTNTLINGNQLKNNTGFGIQAVGTGGAHWNNNTVSNNIIVGDPAISNAVGIFVTVSGSTSEVIGNTWIANAGTSHTGGTEGAGFFGQYISGTFARNKLIGNKFDGNDYGIILQSGILDTALEFNDTLNNGTAAISDTTTAGETRSIGNRNTTANNYTQFVSPLQLDTIRPLTGAMVTFTSAANTQISLTSSAGGTREYATYIDTSGNYFVYDVTGSAPRIKVTSAGLVDMPTSFSIGGGSGLIKTLTGSAALDFPNTMAQTSADLTIAVTGAVNADACFVGVGAAIWGIDISYSCFVSSAGVVSVRFNNYSAGAVDLASDTFRVVLLRF